MTNYDGRCRGGWAFGQGFDSPQVHYFKSERKGGNAVFMRVSAFSVFWEKDVYDRFLPLWRKKSGYNVGYKIPRK